MKVCVYCGHPAPTETVPLGTPCKGCGKALIIAEK